MGLTLSLVTVLPLSAQRPATNTPPLLLTNAQQIAALSNNIPPGRYEARFQAVVIYVSPPTRRLYVQNGDLGVQVNLKGPIAGYRVGNLIEASGMVVGGDPALHLTNAAAKVLGDVPLPNPPLISIHNLVRGDETYRYVRVRGTVRDMYAVRSQLTLLLTQGNYPFEAWFQTGGDPLPRDWMDAEIEVTGHTYLTYSPATGRPTGIRFHATDTNNVRVLKTGLADRFDGRRLLTIAEAAKLPNDLHQRHRVAGTVMIHRPGTAIFIDDSTGVMHIDQTMRFLKAPPGAQELERDPQAMTLQPGDRIEVIGARFNFFSVAPSLQATEFRRLGRAEMVRPIEVPSKELFEGRHAGRLVTTRARLIDHRIWGTSSLRHNMTMMLRDENNMFQAGWEGDEPVEWNLRNDGYVRITGVSEAERSPNSKQSTFKLLIRSPADVAPAPEPPFWKQQEFRQIATAAGIVGLIAAALIGLQRLQMRQLERRVAERTTDLRASEARKAAVLETALDSIITIDQQGRILDFNPAAEKTFGYPRVEVLGREMAELIIPPGLRDRHRAGLKQAVESGNDTMVGRRIEVPALRSNGEEFTVELALARIQTETGPIFTAHIQDISQRKRAEATQRAIYEISTAVHAAEDLKSSYARIHEVVRSVMPADNFFLMLHNPGTDLYEYAYHVDQMDPWPEPRKVAGGLVGYILRSGQSLLVDRASMTNPENPWHFVAGTPAEIWLGVPLRVRGETIGVMAVQDYRNPKAYSEKEEKILAYIGDQTGLAIERKRTDAALTESESRLRQSLVETERSLAQEKELSELKSRFVSMVSHEFRTPLGIIMSSAEILEAYLDRLPPEERRENLRDILQSSQHMARMMEEVLLLGRVEAGKMSCRPRPLDLAVLCAKLADEVTSATAERCPIALKLPPELREAMADESLLRHILTNLLNNAVKYSPPGVTIHFTLECRDYLAIFSVRDRGIGIPEADQRQLFQAFHRGRNVGETAGTGLGMVIVKHCVQLHGGRIAFESREGQGSTFTVALPLFGPPGGFTNTPTQLLRTSKAGTNATIVP